MSNSSSSSVSAYIEYPFSSSQFSTVSCGTGCYRLYSTYSYLSLSYQGIFTCRIQDSRGSYLDLHLGIYPYGFNCKLFDTPQAVLALFMTVSALVCYIDTTDSLSSAAPVVTSLWNIASSQFTLICTSTTSPATTVVWTKDGTTLSFDGTHYQHSQVLTNRRSSTYENILTSSGTPTNTKGNYTCTVSNRFGTSSQSIAVGGNG